MRTHRRIHKNKKIAKRRLSFIETLRLLAGMPVGV